MIAARSPAALRPSICALLTAAFLLGLACSARSGSSSTTIPTLAETFRAATPVSPTTSGAPPATPTATPGTLSYPQIQFVVNDDCAEISRERLPLTELIVTDGLREARVIAEVAATPSQRSQGLMCRDLVPAGTGMLFEFGGPSTSGFWMFNTYAPLDIIYFGLPGGIAVRQMQPCPRNTGESTESWRSRCAQTSANYAAGVTYTLALELPQGWLGSLGFDLEDPASLGVVFVREAD